MFDVKMDFDPDDLKAEVIKAGKEEMLAEAKRVTRSMRCPVHGEVPTVRPTNKGYDLSTCCEEFEKQVIKALEVD